MKIIKLAVVLSASAAFLRGVAEVYGGPTRQDQKEKKIRCKII